MSEQNDTSKLWGGRFSEATDSFVQRFTASVSFDQRLAEVSQPDVIDHHAGRQRVLGAGDRVLDRSPGLRPVSSGPLQRHAVRGSRVGDLCHQRQSDRADRR